MMRCTQHTHTPPPPPTPSPRPQRRDEEALVVEPDKGPDQAVVALPRRDPGIGARDAAVDFSFLLHVRVLHEEAAADLGLAAHLLVACA